ncbi:MAG: hypothetical protein K6E10_09100 [Eubacterium sp.]|nr:hypothetical protein [Eubacterium sp.]
MIEVICGILLYLFLFIVCVMAGYVFFARKFNGLAELIVYGFCINMGFFEILAGICIFGKTSFNVLITAYIILLAVFLIIFIFLFRKYRFSGFKGYSVYKETEDADRICGDGERSLWTDIKGILDFKSPTFYLVLIFMLIVICQIVLTSYKTFIDADDAYYITISNIACFNNRIDMSFSSVYNGEAVMDQRPSIFSWELYLGLLAKIFGFHPAVLAHTLIPGFLIIVSYMAWYLIASSLVDNKNKRLFVMILYALICNFGGYSSYSVGCRMLLRIWQGKSVLACIALPLLLYSCMRIYQGQIGWKLWIVNTLIIISGIGFTVVGIYLMPLSYVIYGMPLLLFYVYRKDFKTLGLVMKRLVISMIPILILGIAAIVSYQSGDTSISEIKTDDWVEVCRLTFGASGFPFVYIASLVFILVTLVRGKKLRYLKEESVLRVFRREGLMLLLLLIIPLFMFLTLLNPLLSDFVATHITGPPVYWRLYWLVPFNFTVAMAGLLVLDINCKKSLKYVMVGILALVIITSGVNIYGNKYYTPHENKYKLWNEAIEVSDSLLSLDSDDSGITCIFPGPLAYQIRQYSSDISLIRARDFGGDQGIIPGSDKTYSWLYASIYVEYNIDSQEVLDILRGLGVEYIYFSEADKVINSSSVADVYSSMDFISVDGYGFLYVIE